MNLPLMVSFFRAEIDITGSDVPCHRIIAKCA